MELFKSYLESNQLWLLTVSSNASTNINSSCHINNSTSSNENLAGRVYQWTMIYLSFFNIIVNLVGFIYCYSQLSRLKSSPPGGSSGASIALTNQRSTLGLLIRLAVVEIAFNVCVCVHFVLDAVIERNPFNSIVTAAIATMIQNISISFMVGFQCTRNWTVVFIALVRMLAVVSPHSWFPKANKRLQSRLYILILLMFLLLTTPRCYEFVYVLCWRNMKVNNIEPSSLLNNQTYKFLYLTVFLFIIQSGGPIILVVIFSSILSQIIMQRRQQRQSTTPVATQQPLCNGRGRHKQQNCVNVNKTVITLSAIFFIFEIPAFISKLDAALNFVKPKVASNYLMYIGNIMTCMDSTMNVVIYILANPKFKRDLLRKLHKKKDNNNMSTFTSCAPVNNQEIVQTYLETKVD